MYYLAIPFIEKIEAWPSPDFSKKNKSPNSAPSTLTAVQE
jgi:hypothetical protein